MQAGALNKHLQPETADLVHRQEAEQEAENRRLGVSDEGKPISGKPDMLDNAAGPQPEPEVELGGATMKTKIPDVLLVPEGLKDAGVSAPGTKKAASVQLHLYHFQVRFLPAICTLPPFIATFKGVSGIDASKETCIAKYEICPRLASQYCAAVASHGLPEVSIILTSGLEPWVGQCELLGWVLLLTLSGNRPKDFHRQMGPSCAL